MNEAFHLLTGEYPPDRGGVADYTHAVAHGLASRGFAVHVWSPAAAADEANVHVHRLPDRFGRASRDAIEAALIETPGCVLVQYVPNAFGARGMNLRFCAWLLHLRRRNVDVRVMFHEPYFYFSRHPLRNVLAATQRAMAAMLLAAATMVYVSTDTWVRYLRPWARASKRMVPLPIPATIPSACDRDLMQTWRERFVKGHAGTEVVGHFGTYGAHLAQELEGLVPLILARPQAQFICLGGGSEVFAARLQGSHPSLAPRIDATGPLAPAQLTAALRACDVVVQPYPDGVTTRRTSVMAALANGVPVVSTAGPLTEPIWAATGAVALAPASDHRAIADATFALLRDDRRRIAMRDAGRLMYETHFALARTIEGLAGARPGSDRGQTPPDPGRAAVA